MCGSLFFYSDIPSQAVKLFAVRNLKETEGPKIIVQDPVFFHVCELSRERAPVRTQIIRHFRAAEGNRHLHGTGFLRFQGEIRQNFFAERGFGGDLDLLRQRNVSSADQIKQIPGECVMEGAGVPAGVQDPVRRDKEDCSGFRRFEDNSPLAQILPDQDLPEDPVVFGIGEKSASAPYIFLDDMNAAGYNDPDLSV